MTAPAYVTPELMVLAKRPSIPVPRGARLVSFEKMIKRVSETQGAKAAAAWTNAVLKHQAHINQAALQAAVASGNVARIAKVIDAAKLASATAAAVTGPLRGAAQTAGQQSAVTLSGHGISATFNHVDPKVVAFARTQAADLVRGVPKDTKRIIGEVIAMGAEGALTTAEQARAIREVVGLPPNWARAPLKFADELRRGAEAAATSRRLSAIDKQLIRSRIRAGTVDKAFIATMQSRYTESLINRRAQTIARTESLRASHFGLQQSWLQMEKAGALPKTARRFWIITPDSHLSPEHARIPAMNPQGRKMNEPFSTTEGMHMFPPSRPNCRCSVGLVFFPPKKSSVAPTAVTPLRAMPKVPKVPKARLAPQPDSPLLRAAPIPTPVVGKVSPATHQAVSAVLREMRLPPTVVKYSTKLGAVGDFPVVGEYRNGKIYLDPRRPVAELRQTVAHEATHLRFERALQNDPNLRTDILGDYGNLMREDGVTAYSRSHWQAFTKRVDRGLSTATPEVRDLMMLPVNETLAELRGLRAAGRTGVGTPRYQQLLARVERAAVGRKRMPAKKALRRAVVELREQDAWAHVTAAAPRWPAPQEAALKRYSGGSSGDLNASLRGVGGQAVSDLSAFQRSLIAHVDEGFAHVTPTTEAMVTYRGGIFPSSWARVGAEFEDLGFVSTSVRRDIADEFVRSGTVFENNLTRYRLQVHMPAGVRALPMDSRVSVASREREVLLPRGSRFRVRAVSQVVEDGLSVHVMDVDYLPSEAMRVPKPRRARRRV